MPETKGCSLNEVEQLFLKKGESSNVKNQTKNSINYLKKSEVHEIY